MNSTSTAIGALVSFNSKVNERKHKRRRGLFSAARGAFLSLVKLNVWGLATLLSKKAFFVSKEVDRQAGVGNLWWDVQGRFRNAWYNVGGSWDKFVNAINIGKNRKALGFAIAPAGIKAKLKAQGIGSYTALGSYNENVGIGVTGKAVLAAVTLASTIYMALKPIIDDLYNKFKKEDVGLSESELLKELEPENNDNKAGAGRGDDGEKAGAGLIGLAALAAIYFGTMSKK